MSLGLALAERLDRLDFPSDFLLCEEAYHHFPRPPIAFCAFLETARRAVVLAAAAEGMLRCGFRERRTAATPGPRWLRRPVEARLGPPSRYPAQQESLVTSFWKAWAASFNASTVVR